MHEGSGLQVVDCGDERPLTDGYNELRIAGYGGDVHPGRFYGAASGVALSALVTIAAQNGEGAVRAFVNEFSAEGFTDFAANMSDRAAKRAGVELNQHSADGNEQNDLTLGDHKSCDKGLGCAFAASLGVVLHGSDQQWVVSEARRIEAETGVELPLTAAVEGLQILQRNIPEEFGIHRGALHHAQTRSGRVLPIAMHEGQHAPNEKTAVVIDMAGWRSSANAHSRLGIPRYHHTVNLAGDLLADIFPEGRLDREVTAAASLLLAASTRLALSGEQKDSLEIEVIPAELAA
jgi:hypothetical protein